MLRKMLIITLLVVILSGCSGSTPVAPEVVLPTGTATPVPVPSPTPTVLPTATPFGGSDAPRIAIFSEDPGPDEKAAGYIRIGSIDLDQKKITFGSKKLNVGTKPGNLPDYFEHLAPDMRWSPDGNYLAYTWAENGKAIISVYDYAAQKMKWELELTEKNFGHTFENGLAWSADSGWLYVEVDRKSHYVLDVKGGMINNLTNNQIQGVVWHTTQPLLYFENFGGSSFYQYDPQADQISEVEPVKFDAAKFENVSSYNSNGRFDPENNGYLFSATNQDESRSFYLEPADDPIFELLRIESTVNRNSLGNIQKVIPAPDRSRYLVAGTTKTFLDDDYEAIFTSYSIQAQTPLVISDMGGANGIYPFGWSPDGKSYIGYQYAIEQNVPTNPDHIVKLVIVNAEDNSIIKSYEINPFKTSSIYGYVLNTSLFDATGPAGVDIYWR